MDIVLYLPFVPNKGITVRFKSSKNGDNDMYFEVTEVMWVHEKNLFIAYVKADEELYEKGRTAVEGLSYKNPERLTEIVKEHIERGWMKTSTEY